VFPLQNPLSIKLQKVASNAALLHCLRSIPPTRIVQALLARIESEGLTFNQRDLLEGVIGDVSTHPDLRTCVDVQPTQDMIDDNSAPGVIGAELQRRYTAAFLDHLLTPEPPP